MKEPQLFIIDPIARLRPAKDSSVALMQAAQRAGQQVWVCTMGDLSAAAPLAVGAAAPHPGHGAWVRAQPVRLADFVRKDPPEDEAYLYATHLLDLGERAGVRVLNRPASLRAWNEKIGALRFSHLMAPSLVSSSTDQLAAFAANHAEVVLKPLGGRAGQGVVRSSASAPGLRALLELVTSQQQLPVMVQAFLPGVSAGDKRILLVDGEALGAINRVPSEGEFRSNLAVGGAPQATELSAAERLICTEIGPALREAGLFFVGIDVIDGRLSEINVTSPTGVREIEWLGRLPLADLAMERLLAA